MYNCYDYGDMIADQVRVLAYEQALNASVHADSVVLDLGAGSGIMTLLACRAGAKKVYAVEPDPVIELAREVVRDNGFQDRVEFIQAASTAVELEEMVDVVVSDVHGTLPLFYGSVASILDARDRLLKPGGSLIPHADTIWAALAYAPEFYGSMVEPWENGFGLDGSAGRRRAVNHWKRGSFSGKALLVEPRKWFALDYCSLTELRAKATVRWTVAEECKAHGFLMWFDCETSPGVAFSNAPVAGRDSIYGQAFFPWPRICPLAAGDCVAIEIRADVVGADFLWSWNTTICATGAPDKPRESFRQSQFANSPLSRDWLRKSSGSFVPAPNMDASIDRLILDLFFAKRALEDITGVLLESFPGRFADRRQALTRVAELSMRYSE